MCARPIQVWGWDQICLLAHEPRWMLRTYTGARYNHQRNISLHWMFSKQTIQQGNWSRAILVGSWSMANGSRVCLRWIGSIINLCFICFRVFGKHKNTKIKSSRIWYLMIMRIFARWSLLADDETMDDVEDFLNRIMAWHDDRWE